LETSVFDFAQPVQIPSQYSQEDPQGLIVGSLSIKYHHHKININQVIKICII